MTFSKSIQKRIEAQTGEKLFTQAEVDALIATERALFAQKAAAMVRSWDNPVHHLDESLEEASRKAGYLLNDVAEAILVLADPNAIAEHDAALRHEATMAEHHNHAQFEAQLYAILVDPVEEPCLPEAEWWEVMRKAAVDQRQAIVDLQDKMAKLEAENAELREALRRSIAASEETARNLYKAERALLAKSGAAK